MRTKPGVDTLSFDDLYNNLRVFESDIKGSTASSSSTQNVAFVSSKTTNSTNDVSTACGVSTSSGHNSQKEGYSSYTDELKYSFFDNQSSGPQLDHKDLEQVDEFDLEEMDLKWQVAMISMRLKKFYKKTGRRLQFDAKEPVGFDKTKVECFNCHNTWHFTREYRSKGNQESRRRDAGNTGYKVKDNTGHAEDEQENFALMAHSNSGSNTEVTSCSKECKESYGKLKKLYDEQREQLGVASIEIQAYTQALKKGQIWAWDGNQIHEGVLSYEKEVLESVFDSRSSDEEDSLVNDRFAKVEGMHAVPPLMTRIYMPSKSDFGIDESKFTYGPKQSKTSESDAKTSDTASCESNSSVETPDSVPKPAVNEPTTVSKSKVWSDAPIIEEYESDSDDEYVIEPSKEQEKPSFAFVNTNGLMSKKLGLGYGFTKKACFVCGSFSHLIRDYDFHEKRMAKQVELNKQKGKGTGQGENRPVWNNVQRLNHQNKFVPKAVLTKTGIFLVNAARQNPSSQAAETSTARKVNTARPIVNEIRQRNNFYKSHSPIRRPFNKSTAPKANFTNHKVNTAGDKIVSAVRGYRETAVKASAGCNWRPKRHYWNKVSKYNSGSNSNKNDDPQKALKNKGFIDSGCSRHMTGNKAYLVEYQDYNDGPMCDKKNKVLFTDTECLVLSPDFKLPDENQVLLRVPKTKQYVQFQPREHCSYWRFSWVFFLRIKDETSGILKYFIRQIENQLNQNVKSISYDNGTKFKNREIIEFCGSKGIKREYCNARTPQKNGVAERKNMTLIEATRTMLADSFLPNTFWAKAVSTACYVLNRVLVTKPQNKTPYELITGKIPIISYIRPFGCHVTILNTIDHLVKFEEKSDEGFLVRYSLNSKAFLVYNLETKRVEEKLHINFLENKPNVAGKGPNWLFDLDYLTDSMNYQPVTAENKANKTAGPKEANHSVVKSSEAKNGDEKPNRDTGLKINGEPKDQENQAFLEELERLKRQEMEANDAAEAFRKEFAQCTEDLFLQAGAARATSTNTVNAVSIPVSTESPSNVFSTGGPDLNNNDQDGAVADFTNLETTMNVSPIPTSRIHSIHPTTQILRDLTSAVQTRSKVNKSSGTHAFKISQALEDESWVDAMQEELLNKKDERGVVVRNKARMVAQGYRQEEWIYYDEVFALVARIEAIMIFLAFAS
ncbi:putative ribonuclease H-like domain-containing protein [Tanacetum coccineum]